MAGENPFVYFDVAIGGKRVGRITFELRRDVAPRTVENFLLLCTGEALDKLNPKKLCYKGTRIHRIVPGQLLQGGDVTKTDGTGGESVYGRPFEDETFELKHCGRGILSMAHTKPHTNTSQFFVTFEKMPMLDRRHVVFGYVCDGVKVLRMIETAGTPVTGRPKQIVEIVGSGQCT